MTEQTSALVNFKEMRNSITHATQLVGDTKPGTKQHKLLTAHLEKLIRSIEIALGITEPKK